MEHKALGRTHLKVSRLGLGTAEIGFAYGIGPRTLPSESEAVDFLKAAVDLGITFFDTARFYQAAEEHIGKSGITKNEKIIVATKCANFLEKKEQLTDAEIEKRIREEVETSLKLLQVDSLPLLQLHGASEKEIRKGYLLSLLQQLQKEGKVRFIGISTRGEESPLAALEEGIFDTMQIAYSILDRRMTKKVFPEAEKKNVGIINRSFLLKGALTPAVEYLHSDLGPLKKNSEKARELAEKNGMELPEMAIRFALGEAAISTTLIGTNNLKNLTAALKAIEAGPLAKNILEELYPLAIDDPLQVDPAQWPKK